MLNGLVLSSQNNPERIPDISYFHVFGCPVFIHNHKDHLSKFDAKADDGYFLGYSFVSKAVRVFNIRRQQVEETYHVTFDEKDDPSRKYQVDSDVSYYIIPHGRSLTKLTQENHVPEMIAPNEPDIPHSEDTEGNNTDILGSITESLVPDVPQSHILNQASTSSHHVPHDRWSRYQHIELVNIIGDPGEGMLTRSMDAKLTAALSSECLFTDFLFEIKPKKDDKGISIFQEQYTSNLLKKYEISDSSLVKTPMVPPNNLGPDLAGKSVNETSYRGMIGSLMYLKGTPTLGLYYPKCSGFDLKGYSDLDFAGCNMDRKSTSGTCQILGGKLVCWSAKKQHSVAMSLSKAEYVDAARCCASILWMKSQLNDYDIHYKMVPIFCDNTSAIAISNNLVLHSRTKHIDIRYHFIRDHILKEDIELHFIPTEYQLADIFIKPLDEPTFTRLKAELGMLNIN
ncbi:hypothetical protein Tco_0694273 [Tanacetum coccineum]